MKTSLYGLIMRPLSSLVPIKKKHWIFGADYGNMYREGSKYLLEYMLKYHPEYDCIFITRNRNIIDQLRSQGIPVAHNFSIKGLYKIIVADCVFTTQVTTDILFAYPKKGRGLFYLVHGQPFKCALGRLPQETIDMFFHKTEHSLSNKIKKIRECLGYYLSIGYDYNGVDFVSATSEFTASLMRTEFKPNVDVLVLGMPRNDALFQKNRMKREKWITEIDGKYVVTYMPTHRKYGEGEISPIPFLNNKIVQKWMRDNNVILLIKQHPNMVKHYSSDIKSDVIIDISKERFDPQVVIYHTDVLITDYSSVWMDYLLLKRPLIFYFYDNFESEDVGTYYDLREEFPNNFCQSEDSLFDFIKTSVHTPYALIPDKNIICKFHKYTDGYSCQRYYEEVSRRLYNEK